jgi:nucleoside-diphosphate-sugar epimerase
MKNNTDILVIGGAGYVGCEVIKYFLNKKIKVTCIDNLLYGQKFNLKHKLLNFKRIDISKKNELNKINKYYSTVVVLAGLVGDPVTKKYKKLSKIINDKAIENLIDHLNEKQLCKKLFFISTCSNYGLVKKNIKIKETATLKPLSSYAKSKVKIERKILNKKNYFFSTTVFRFATAFGLSERMRYDLTINQFVLEMYVNKFIEIYDHKTWRPYCHLKDFARLIFKSYKADPKLIDKQVFNAGSTKNNYNKIQIANSVKKYIGGKIKIVKQSKDKRNYKVDFKKVEKTLNFKCLYGLDYGIKSILSNLKKQNKNNLRKNFLLGNFKVIL